MSFHTLNYCTVITFKNVRLISFFHTEVNGTVKLYRLAACVSLAPCICYTNVAFNIEIEIHFCWIKWICIVILLFEQVSNRGRGIQA